MAGAGVALGVPLALAAQRVAVTFVDNMSRGPDDADRVAAAAMIAVAALAASVPARRASRVNPDRSAAAGVALSSLSRP